ncbi:hypothetical protein K502DRAFT_109878 [Neoconidiobolus thromboides FSU 785]|nr:hypothetical protein K502DRAFT_109878 [Neoconidiobolus thromboides FSU 785]
MWNNLGKIVSQHISSSTSNNYVTSKNGKRYDIEKSKYPKQIKELIEIFPDCDPYYLEHCCSYYKDRHVERICDKFFNLNYSHYPTVPKSLSLTPYCSATRNYYLEIINELFPDVEVGIIREVIISSRHSIIYEAVDRLLKYNGKYLKRKDFNKIDKKDYFRSESYAVGAKNRLYNLFPKTPRSTIRAILAETNHDFLASYDRLTQLNSNHTWMSSLIGMMVNRDKIDEPSMYTFELLQQINQLENKDKKSIVQLDREYAIRLNQEQYAKENQVISCQCCYTDFTFEELCQCTKGHLFCIECVNKYVSETIYGQSDFKEKGYISCIDISGCKEKISELELKRILKSDLLESYFNTKLELELESSKLPLVRCPFCRYVEIDNPKRIRLLNWLNFFKLGLLITIIEPMKRGLFLFYPILLSLRILLTVLTVIGISEVTSFNLLDYLPITYIPDSMIKLPDNRLFQCRNTECNKLSCRLCHTQSLLSHQCMEDEKDALRLKVEAAMAEAVKRTCPNCNLSFTKLDGCNKMTCRCGYIMCYLCREGIQQQMYSHFCDHFRFNPGEPCRQCDKCDLYKDANDELEMKKAAEQASQVFFIENPSLKNSSTLNLNKNDHLSWNSMEILSFWVNHFFY